MLAVREQNVHPLVSDREPFSEDARRLPKYSQEVVRGISVLFLSKKRLVVKLRASLVLCF